MALRFALPKGNLATGTNDLLQTAGIGLNDYGKKTRLYRLKSNDLPDLDFKILHEKDVPIQVSIGNYDIGICGLDWVEELMAKYPSCDIIKLKNLKYGEHNLCIAVSQDSKISSLDDLRSWPDDIRIASEYPNLAEAFALKLRLRRFRILSIWGAAEALPPENADIILLSCSPSDTLNQCGLNTITTLLQSNACIIVNRESWKNKDMSRLLELLSGIKTNAEEDKDKRCSLSVTGKISITDKDSITLALPDGHQKEPTVDMLKKAGFSTTEYAADYARPDIGYPGLTVKVIRPQDMPLQVANGYFDLAVTGEDWLREHLYRFPSSPVKEIIRLGFGGVRIVAVVHNDLPLNDPAGLRELLKKQTLPSIRVVSEYVNIADRYAWDKHLSPYRVIPSWGASEAFLPEDADLLIENTQTGQTLVRNNLKIIDTLFHSSACLVGNIYSMENPEKMKKINKIVEKLRQGLPVEAEK